MLILWGKKKKKIPNMLQMSLSTCAHLLRLQTTGDLVSADKALIVVHQMLQGPFISKTPQVYGCLRYAVANVYHHFHPLIPKFILIIMGNHGGLYKFWPVRRHFAITTL